MLIRPADRGSEPEWRSFLAANSFGHLISGGRDRDLPVVVPTQFVMNGDEVVLHLATPNPIWAAIEENDQVLLSVAGDWSYIPSDWKVVGDEDPRRGIPTTYYAAVQLVGTARVLDDPEAVAGVLREQLGDLQPEVDVVDPISHGAKLGAIRGLRISIREVRAKFKYGGNVDVEHRQAVAQRLTDRDGLGDAAARRHLVERMVERMEDTET